MKNPNGLSVEEADEQRDAYLDAIIEEQTAKASNAVQAAKCCVCHVNWVDVLNGEDTCQDCLTNQ